MAATLRFTPTGSGTYTFILKATDACGLMDYDTSPRVCDDESAAGCECGPRHNVYSSVLRLRSASRLSCSDPDGNLSTCQLISSPGSYSGGNITFTPTGSGTYTFILKATDACGLTAYDTSVRICDDESAAGCECGQRHDTIPVLRGADQHCGELF